MATNPVIFEDFQSSEQLVIYSDSLSEFYWKNRIVGVTENGFLYVDERVARKGYYEFYPKLIPWDQIVQVTTGRCVSVMGIIFGALLMMFGLFAFSAGWINKTHEGLGIFTIPVLCGIGGGTLVFGAIRNRITVLGLNKQFAWMSPPLTYKQTRPICQQAKDLALLHNIPVDASRT